jgi:hypothetical protein
MTHQRSLRPRISFVPAVILLSALAASGQSAAKSRSGPAPIVLDFCDLIENADRYVSQKVQLRATYMYGFEVAELYCLGCQKEKVWVEFDDSFEKNSSSRERKKIKPNRDAGRTVNITAIGVLYAGSFGHFGVYPLKFVITALKKADVVTNVGLPPRSLSVEAQKKLCKR